MTDTPISALQAAYDRAEETFNAIDEANCCKKGDVNIRREEASKELFLQSDELRHVILREPPASPHDVCVIAAHMAAMIEYVSSLDLCTSIERDIGPLKLASENVLVYLAGQFDFIGGSSRFLGNTLEFAADGVTMRTMKKAA